MSVTQNLTRNITQNLTRDITITGGFNVLDIANISYWGDSSDTSATNIIESADAVSQVTDKSPAGNNFVQASSTLQPLTNTFTQNGLNVIRFDGSDDYLEKTSYTASESWTMYMVASIISVSTLVDSIFSLDASKDFQLDAAANSEYLFRFRSAGLNIGSFDGSVDQVGQGFKLFSVKLDFVAQTIELLINNSVVNSVNNYDDDAIDIIQHARIGGSRDGSRNVQMDLAEIILVNEATSISTDLEVFNYAKDKWAL